MIINTDIIRDLKPCQQRLDNFLEHYPNFNGDINKFLNLKKITYFDKLWVIFRVLPKKDVIKLAGLFAQHVLHIYEKKYPNDNRVRNCVNTVLNPKSTKIELNNAADAAADAVRYAADAAWCAADAAWCAADEESFQIKTIKLLLKGKK